MNSIIRSCKTLRIFFLGFLKSGNFYPGHWGVFQNLGMFIPGDWRFSEILGFLSRGLGIFISTDWKFLKIWGFLSRGLVNLGVFLFPRFFRHRVFFVGLDIPPKTSSGLKGRIGLVDGARVKIKSAYLTKIGFLVSDSSCSFLFRSCQ